MCSCIFVYLLIRSSNFVLCSTEFNSFNHISLFHSCFTEFNGCTKRLLKQTLDSFENNNKDNNNNIKNKNHNDTNLNRLSDKNIHSIKPPYKGDHCINLIKSIKTSTKNSLAENMTSRLFQQGPN